MLLLYTIIRTYQLLMKLCNKYLQWGVPRLLLDTLCIFFVEMITLGIWYFQAILLIRKIFYLYQLVFTKYLGEGLYIITRMNLFLSLYFWHVSTLKVHLQRVTRNERTVINSNIFGKDLLTKLQKLIYNYPNKEGWGLGVKVGSTPHPSSFGLSKFGNCSWTMFWTI